MILELHDSKILDVEMGVNLSGADGTVTQKLLNNAKVSPSLQDVGRKRMSNHVGPNFGYNA